MVKEVLWRRVWWRKLQEGVTLMKKSTGEGNFDEEEYRQVKRIAEIAY